MAQVPLPGLPPAVPSPPDEEDELGGKMSFLEHLDELRNRIIYCCIATAIGVVATFAFINPIFNYILAPTRRALPSGVRLIYTQPGEAFSLYVTVALIAGVLVAAPFIMYQVWMFVAPGLYANEKRLAIPFVFLTTVGFMAGALFNHYIAFPYMMVFFGSFHTKDLSFMPRLDDVFGLYTKMLIGMGIVFQMPTVVYFLSKMKLITARFLLANFKYALLIIFILAAVITPSCDMMTQMIFAAPMLALYFLSIGIAFVFGPKRAAQDDASD
jgi:sec-independent protein translocase protein TatC